MDIIGSKKDVLSVDCLIPSDSELGNGKGDAALGGSESGEFGGYKVRNANDDDDAVEMLDEVMAVVAEVDERISDVSERVCAADAKISNVSAKVYRFEIELERVDRHIRNI